jgi:AcrR family transcriptional regulator
VGVDTKKGLSAAERRRTLLDAAWKLLREQGPKHVTIDAVVERLGITRPVFYRHFADRNALLVALYERYADELASTQQAVLFRADGTLEELLHAALVNYLDLIERHGPFIRPLVDVVRDDPRMLTARAVLQERLLTSWQSAIARRVSPELLGVLAVDERARAALGVLILLLEASAYEAATAWLEGRVDRTMCEEMLGLLEAGIAVRFSQWALGARG